MGRWQPQADGGAPPPSASAAASADGPPPHRCATGRSDILPHDAPADQVDDRKQHDRADQRVEKALDPNSLVDVHAAEQPRDERADDADDDVEDDSLLGVGSHDQAGEPSDNAADDQPDDDVHEASLLVPRPSATRAVAVSASKTCDARLLFRKRKDLSRSSV